MGQKEALSTLNRLPQVKAVPPTSGGVRAQASQGLFGFCGLVVNMAVGVDKKTQCQPGVRAVPVVSATQ